MTGCNNHDSLTVGCTECFAAVLSEKAAWQSEKAAWQSEKTVLQSEKAVLQSEKAAWQTEKTVLQTEKTVLQTVLQSEKAAWQTEKTGFKHALEPYPTLDTLADRAKRIYTETSSDAFTNTDHQVATSILFSLPDCYIPDSFWSSRSKTDRDFLQGIGDEAMVNYQICSLVQDVVNALGLSKAIEVHFDTPVLDTKPDILLIRAANKRPVAVGEGKKPGKGEKTPESNAQNQSDAIFSRDATNVNGEVMEQLHIVSMHTEHNALGFISTFNEWAVTSTIKNLASVDENDFNAMVRHFNRGEDERKPVTPDRPSHTWIRNYQETGAVTDSTAKCVGQKRKGAVSVRTKRGKNLSKRITNSESKKGTKGKDGTAARNARRKKVKREYFQTERVEWGRTTEESRSVLELLAKYVIFAAQSTMESELKGSTGPLAKCKTGIPCRYLDLGKGTFVADEVIFQDGIFLSERPALDDSTFFIIQPLGQGGHGVCCLAASSAGHVCAIKFLHSTSSDTLETRTNLATQEVNNWEAVYKGIYSKEGCKFVEFKVLGKRVFLFLPFFVVPIDLADRKELLVSGKLLRGLQFFAEQQRIHTDLKWSHLGIAPDGKFDMVFLLDLGEGVEECRDQAALDEWVKQSMTMLLGRMGAVVEDVPEAYRVLMPEDDK